MPHWDGTLLVMACVPEFDVLGSWYFWQLEQSEQIPGALARYLQVDVQRGEARSYSMLNRMVNSHLEQKEKPIVQCERQQDGAQQQLTPREHVIPNKEMSINDRTSKVFFLLR